jgi:general secretion pathway protein G
MRTAGYTLLEMLVVVAIVGTLAALVAPGMVGRTDQARRVRALADMRAIAHGLHLYRLDVGRVPTTEQGIDALVARPSHAPVPPRWNPRGYLTSLPTDPWGAPYVYAATSESTYSLRSLGADGAAGGTGTGADIELEEP